MIVQTKDIPTQKRSAKKDGYDVFISYSRADYVDKKKNVIPGNEVSKVKDALTKAGITYWFDEDGIYSGQDFVEKIVTNIKQASIFIFLSSANANKSEWTSKEIASAYELKKIIIPVRIDSTPYNEKVLFRIADLDYIEYYSDPQKGMEKLIYSVKAHLEALAEEELRKKEQEEKKKRQEREKEEILKRQKEEAEKSRQEEQRRLVADIKLSCTTLNNEETKLELDRETLLLKTEKVSDAEQRASLVKLITNGGAIHKKYQEKVEKLTKENNDLKTEITQWEMKCQTVIEDIREKKEVIKSLNTELNLTEKRLNSLNFQLASSEDPIEKQLLLEKTNKDGTLKKKSSNSRLWEILFYLLLFASVIFLFIFTMI